MHCKVSNASINGVPACANKRFLTDILRKEWGYDGFVISDDAAVEYIHAEHHYNSTFERAAVEAVKAGCNVALVGKFDPAFWKLKEAVHDGLITEKELMENLRPVMRTRFLLGEFDPQELNPYNQITKDDVLSAEHRQLALEAAIKSFVLLKNENSFLPIAQSDFKTVSVSIHTDITICYLDGGI
jgi:beta-glucosidase